MITIGIPLLFGLIDNPLDKILKSSHILEFEELHKKGYHLEAGSCITAKLVKSKLLWKLFKWKIILKTEILIELDKAGEPFPSKQLTFKQIVFQQTIS
jgi:hypothetical protein